MPKRKKTIQFIFGELQEVTALKFRTALRTRNKIVLMVGAPHCEPCRRLKPYLTEVAEKQEKVITMYVSIEGPHEVSLANDYMIRAVPMVIAFRNKKPVYQNMGSPKAIDEAFEKLS